MPRIPTPAASAPPGAYENSLAVASADNIANTAEYFTVNGANYTYADGAGKTFTGGATCKSAAFTTLDKSEDKSGTEYDFVFIGDPTDPDDTVKYGGEKSDFANTAGKIVLVSRGNGVAFTDKQINADAAKAAAIIVYNNVDGFDAIYAACTKKLPFITIRLDQMKAILASATQDENGVWGGKLTVHGSGVYTDMNATGGVITMSSFSSWGVPGDLSLKPEITAPGGNIYSTRTDGTYGLMSGTSMASPSAAGPGSRCRAVHPGERPCGKGRPDGPRSGAEPDDGHGRSHHGPGFRRGVFPEKTGLRPWQRGERREQPRLCDH